MTPYFIYMTAKNQAEARKIAKALVTEKLAACVNILPEMTSIYRWEGEVEESKEVAIIAKTRKNLFKKLEKRVRELHSYDCPCIIALPIEDGSKPFLKWIKAETK